MTPIITIIDALKERGGESVREKKIKIFGFVVFELIESCQFQKDRPVGFSSNGAYLTYVGDE